jgi:DHA2 family multidrug resistance protein
VSVADGVERHRGLITLFLVLASTMQALDATIANVALPHIQGSLSASQDQITWVLTSYLVAAAIMTPMGGWLSGRFGRKRVFVTSIAGFTLASAACGMAGSLSELLIFRALQGVCGATLVPLSQAVLLDINPREKQGQAMAVWGMGINLGPIVGPILGGWLTQNLDWRWVFYINLPIGLLTFFGILFFVPSGQFNIGRKLDCFGFGTLALSIACFQLFLDRGELKDWFASKEICFYALLASLCAYLFTVHTATAKDSFIRIELLTDRNFVLTTLAGGFVGFIFTATLALLPPMLQSLLRYPVVLTGVVLMPRGFGLFVAMTLASWLINKVDSRWMIGAGFCITSMSLWEMSGFSPEMDIRPIVTSGVVQGLGLGFVFVPLSTVAFAGLPANLRTEAAGIFSLVRNAGGSIGISAMQSLLTENTQIFHSRLGEHLRLDALQRDWPSWQASGLSASRLVEMNALVTRQATMIAYINDFWIMMIVTLLPLSLVLWMKRRPSIANTGVSIIE